MKYSNEQIKESLIEELNDALESKNGHMIKPEDIIDFDLENETISIKFPFFICEEDDYIGFVSY